MDFWIKFPDQDSIDLTWPTEKTLDTSEFDPTRYNRRILSAQNSDSTYFRIMQKASKKIEISVPTIIATFSIDTYLSAGSWHHFAFVQKDNGGKMYLDGSIEDTDNSSGKVFLLSTIKTYVGADVRDLTTSPKYFSGKVYELRIYSRALSASEIQALYNN